MDPKKLNVMNMKLLLADEVDVYARRDRIVGNREHIRGNQAHVIANLRQSMPTASSFVLRAVQHEAGTSLLAWHRALLHDTLNNTLASARPHRPRALLTW